MTLVCVSRGGNPLATVTWYKNGLRIDSSYTTVMNGSKNTYEFTASEEDNNAVYSCQAKNELIVKPLKAEITTIVQCKWFKEATPQLLNIRRVLILNILQTAPNT